LDEIRNTDLSLGQGIDKLDDGRWKMEEVGGAVYEIRM
jgi:hypothetical protein